MPSNEIRIDLTSSVHIEDFITRYGIACESMYFINLIPSSFFMGQVLGSFLMIFLSEKIPKLKGLKLTTLIMVIAGVV